MIVVNMFAGPGTGKSTTSAAVFSELKWKGINCEIVTEYAKDVVWEGSSRKLENQIYVFAKQLHRLWRLKDQVDVIVTDSPILFSIIYDKEKNEIFKNLVLQEFNRFNNFNIFLNRKKPYVQSGRLQTEMEARLIDIEIMKLLVSNNFPYIEQDASKDNVQNIVSSIIAWMNASGKLSFNKEL